MLYKSYAWGDETLSQWNMVQESILKGTKFMGHPDQNELDNKHLVNLVSPNTLCTSRGEGQPSIVFIGPNISFHYVKVSITTTTFLPNSIMLYTCEHI